METEEMQTAAVIKRPVPVPDPDSAPFWEACREHRLTVQQCDACGQRRFPPVGICHRCRSWDFSWVEVTEGTVHSWVVCHHGVIESLRQETPYVVAVVDLGSGIHLPTNLVDIDPSEIRPDMRVSVRFQEIEGGFTIPVFAPVAAAGE
jgi:uncharacterized OB-fold protein